MVAPNGCPCGSPFCRGTAGGANEGPRQIVIDPTSQRGFAFSTDQTGKGRPEFLFLDTPANQLLAMTCVAIMLAYEREDTAPSNMAAVTFSTPFGDDEHQLSFVLVSSPVVTSRRYWDSTISTKSRRNMVSLS